MQQSYCKNKKSNVKLLAGAWLRGTDYRSFKTGISGSYQNKNGLYRQLKQKEVFSCPVERYSRFDDISKTTCCLIALSLKDAGIEYSPEKKQNIAIIGSNKKASLNSNYNYFSDYLKAGRTLARGNLFIYTIPTSPLAESAIYFGLQGELVYVNFSQDSIEEFLNYAALIFSLKEEEKLLAVTAQEDKGICLLLEKTENKDYDKDNLNKILNLGKDTSDLDKFIEKLRKEKFSDML